MEKELNKKTVEDLLQKFVENPGYLLKSGCLLSMKENRAADMDGVPFPWITYPALDFLEANGFTSLEFWGMGALAIRRWCTSIFYRSVNCLGIQAAYGGCP